MKHTVATLDEGPLLDAAVVLAMGGQLILTAPDNVPQHVRERWPAEGVWLVQHEGGSVYTSAPPPYSSRAEFSEPIIEKERVMTMPTAEGWRAQLGVMSHPMCGDPVPDGSGRDGEGYGPTRRVAALRALINEKFGDEVGLP